LYERNWRHFYLSGNPFYGRIESFASRCEDCPNEIEVSGMINSIVTAVKNVNRKYCIENSEE